MRKLSKILSQAAFFSFLLILFSFPILTQTAHASSATIYLSPAVQTFETNAEIALTVYIKSTDMAVNTVQGSLSFPADLLNFESTNKKNSVFSFWVSGPEVNGNTINFSVGTPNPGYKGDKGRVFTMIFKAKAPGKAKITFTSARVLANDGKATDIETQFGNSELTIIPTPVVTGTDQSTLAPTSESISSEKITGEPGAINSDFVPTEPPVGIKPDVLGESTSKIDTSFKAPEVTDYLKTVDSKSKYFFVKGKSDHKNSELILTVIFNGVERKNYSITTDKEGNFEYIARSSWPAGKYDFTLKGISALGIYGPDTEKLSFEVKENKLESSVQIFTEWVPFIIIIGALVFLISALIKNWLKNKRINKHLKEAIIAIDKENEAPLPGNPVPVEIPEPSTSPDPRIKSR